MGQGCASECVWVCCGVCVGWFGGWLGLPGSGGSILPIIVRSVSGSTAGLGEPWYRDGGIHLVSS